MQLRGARRIRHVPPAENGVWVTDGTLGFEISESIYCERGYDPPFESLSWSSPAKKKVGGNGQKHGPQKNGPKAAGRSR
jgi:hypothetical protein